ncbi:MFS general substrate transporter [Thelephora terrestris]|uniref:MFS general substrate transporter n=1 Tax=Thelephora terrestris TaxID=56493 RepID=A0A9P6HR62_9AGAM|nr:MFS general substrate transporter [Thelephora terrestris]
MSDARSKSSATQEEKSHGALVTSQEVDIGAEFTAGKVIHLDPEEALRLRRKLDWHLLPLMCVLYLVTFIDKITLGQSAVLGIIKSNHLSANQFNWLGTIFFLSYLVFIYPQSLALQRWPVGKWMSINVFIWSIALFCHAACKSFGGLFAARFVLGVCEGAITPGFMIVMAMFYTRAEQMQRTGYWFLMNGAAVVILGFLAFGCIHIKTPGFEPWQWLIIITGILTLITAALFWFFFPDSPTNAWFLTPEERIKVVARVRENQAGVENKSFKKEQVIEALTDPKTWLFAFFAGSSTIWNSLTNQRQIILNLFGFSLIQTTLLGCVDGVIDMLAVYLGVTIAARWKNGKAWTAMLSYVPSVIGTILVATLPGTNKIGLLFSYWISIWGIVPFVIFLSWVGMSTSGHTKRITVNAIVLIAYAIGNAAGPFIWQSKYKPRNRVPFAIISACSVTSAFVLFVIRQYLASQNRKKDEQAASGEEDKYDEVYITVMEDGKAVEKKVDKAFQDLTDLQNREFRYVL